MAFLVDQLEIIYDPEPHSAPVNMAMDEVLLKRCAMATLRVYRWDRPSASFGYFEPYDRVFREHPDRALVRRWTGGGTVLHGHDFTYTLVAPRGNALERLRIEASYLEVHQRLSGLLGGVLTPEKSTDHATACFQNPTLHDVLIENRKIAGAAQRRTRWGLLHQGSIQTVTLPEGFTKAFAGELAEQIRERELSREELAEAQILSRQRYETDSWNKRV